MDKQTAIKAIIIDDEIGARQAIKDMLNIYCQNINVIAEADGVLSGLQAIKKEEPDLVFLDIKMKDGNGFDLLNRIEDKNFALIFLTAYDEFAIKAFRFSAIDYLLKPLDSDELIRSMEKVKRHLSFEKKQLNQLIENLNAIKKESKKITLKTQESIFLVNIIDIIRCEATGNYTKFYLTNQKPVLVSRTLKDYHEMLSEYPFFRSHQSHLVNLEHVIRFDKVDGGNLIMKDEQCVPVSTRRKDGLLKAMGDF